MNDPEQSAYPLHALGTTATGLTKRELFAAMAMQGLMARYGSDDYMPVAIARYATDYADALLSKLDNLA